MNDQEGKVAIITGGARGIGAATSRLFVEQGMWVIIADIQEEAGQTLAAELGRHAEFRRVDVSREADVASVIGHAKARHGRLDCLLNNAGLSGPMGSIEECGVEDFDRVLSVLLRGVFLGIKHAAPLMKRQRSGSIINTASIAGLRAGYGGHLYSAAKAAVVHLTTTTAMELGESGVRVNCICPGGIATPLLGAALGLSPDTAAEMERLHPIMARLQPLRRPGLPDDIARAALWLASDASSFVTGHALVVDGGASGGRQWSVAQQQWQMARGALNGTPVGG